MTRALAAAAALVVVTGVAAGGCSSGPAGSGSCLSDGCPAGQLCNQATQACESPAQGCSAGSCPDGLVCSETTHRCELPQTCDAGSCPDGQVCAASGLCEPDPLAGRPPGNSCATAIRLTLDAQGRASATATSVGALPDAPSSCVFAPRKPSIAFELSLPYRAKLKVTVTPLDPAFDVGLSVNLSTCGEMGSVSCFTGGNGPGEPETLEQVFDPGPFTFVALSNDGTSGRFRIDVQALRWADNDTCGTAAPLPLDGGRSSLVVDTTFSDSSLCSCVRCLDHHLAWRLSTVGMGVRSLVATAIALDGGYQPQLMLASQCETYLGSPAIACGPNPAGETRARIDEPRLPEGDYYLRLGGVDGGLTRLDVTLAAPISAPANDTCATAAPLDFTAATSISVNGNTSGAKDDDTFEYPCGTANIGRGRDVLYSVQTPGRGTLDFLVTPLDADYDPVLRLDTFCTPAQFCANAGGAGQPDRLTHRTLDTTLSLAVDGVGNTAGAFQLTGTFTPGPANDLCSATAPLAGNVATPSTGDTRDGYDDYNTCSRTVAGGPDLYYRFSPSANGTVTVRVQPAGFDAFVGVLSTCVGSCLAYANAGDVGVAEQLSLSVTKNTTYYVVVDGVDGGGGPFTLSVQ